MLIVEGPLALAVSFAGVSLTVILTKVMAMSAVGVLEILDIRAGMAMTVFIDSAIKIVLRATARWSRTSRTAWATRAAMR